MSLSPKYYYTPVSPETVKSHAITSEAAGFPIENAMDWNLDTYWKPTSTADQNIDFDFGSAVDVEGVVFWYHNYLTDHRNGSTAKMQLWWSDNGSAWTQVAGDVNLQLVQSEPLDIMVKDLGATHRYWRVTIKTLNTTVEISQIMLFNRRTTSTNSSWPDDDTEIFANKTVKAPGGRELVIGINKGSVKEFSRNFVITGTTDFNTLVSVFQATRGGVWPLVLTEGSTLNLPKMCRFDRDEIEKAQNDFELYDIELSFKTLPYIRDGEVF